MQKQIDNVNSEMGTQKKNIIKEKKVELNFIKKESSTLLESIFGKQLIRHILKENICKSCAICAKVPGLRDTQTAGETSLRLVFL